MESIILTGAFVRELERLVADVKQSPSAGQFAPGDDGARLMSAEDAQKAARTLEHAAVQLRQSGLAEEVSS